MRGKATLFPPQNGFAYWNEHSEVMQHIKLVGSTLGKIVTLEKRATCRMCGKVMHKGEQARIDGYLGDFEPHYLKGYIHKDKCIPVIKVVFGEIGVDDTFEELYSIQNDNMYFEDGFYCHSLEEAIEDTEHLLNGYFCGVYPLAYIELDGIRHPSPICMPSQ